MSKIMAGPEDPAAGNDGKYKNTSQLNCFLMSLALQQPGYLDSVAPDDEAHRALKKAVNYFRVILV